MSDKIELNKEVDEYIDKLNNVVQNNKDAVDIYNLVDKTHKSSFPKFQYKSNLFYGIGIVLISSLFYFLYWTKMPSTQSVKKDSTTTLSINDSKLNNSDSANINSEFKIDSISKQNYDLLKIDSDSIKRPIKLTKVDSLIETYSIKVDKERFKIFDISNKIIDLIKQNDFDILISDISRDKGKIITRNKSDYSNTFGKMIFYSIEYYVSSEDIEFNIKMNIVNKSSNVQYSENKHDKIPNSIEKQFYDLMKQHISSFYGN